MKKVLSATVSLFFMITVFGQQDSLNSAVAAEAKTVTPKRQFDLSNRSSDYLMIQLGYAGWNGISDSINTGGLPRSFNVYFMFDFPFKSNPKISAAAGLGIGTDHIFFKKTSIGIEDLTSEIRIRNIDAGEYFKKYKLATVWLEAPIELRYTAKPDNPNKSFKAALGVKVGTLLKAYTKGKVLRDIDGGTVNSYTEKISSKRFFNTVRVVPMVRVGYGHISLFGTYSLTGLFKEDMGPAINTYSIGITLSGL